MEGSAYIHSTSPKPVSSKMKKAYRDEDEENLAGNNIMFDRRVVRGNTYAAQVVTQNAQREVERLRQENERTLRREATRRRREQLEKPSTPPAVDGRAHMEAQTETFLEELADRPVEAEATTQTEPFVDRPPQVLFVPSKTGVDKETEIPGGDLFDFDVEVKPILEVLVGKTLRISMLEVMEEEELEAIRRQREFEQMRNAELMEVQRLDAEASRKFAEKQRRVAQEKERLRMQAELETKVAARSFARNYLVDLSDAVFDALETTGHFYDPVLKEVEDVFLPWLLDGVVADADNHGAARACSDALVADAMELAAATQAAVLADIKAKEEARLAAIAEAERLAAEEAARLEAEARARRGRGRRDAPAGGRAPPRPGRPRRPPRAPE
ncbi:Radial spoke protein 3 [Aureococcus anophagefferens]|nr:Radial spoke protein 3 [Aureococcus anophagefferens]